MSCHLKPRISLTRSPKHIATYDGNGLRVKRVSGGTTTVYIFSGSKVVAEYDNGAAPSAPSREYIYGGSALLAKIDSSGTKYYHQDHLSNRLVTSSTGATLEQMGHFPFGESWYNATGDKLLFTTYERDAESGNDYAQARYYVNRLARFSILDPLSGSTSDPQTLNRYTYVRNSPVGNVDPTGKMMCVDMCPNWGNGGGGGGGGEGGDDITYIVDGLAMPSSMNSFFSQMLSVGLGFAQCPQNTCSFVSSTGQFVHYIATATGGNYYAYSGPGAANFTQKAAGTAGALYAQQLSSNDPVVREYGGTVYVDSTGIYSYNTPTAGDPCDLSNQTCTDNFNQDIPDDATGLAIYHDHPLPGQTNFSSTGMPNDVNTLMSWGLPGYLATLPMGRVIYFDPHQYARSYFDPNATPVCFIQGPSLGVPACH